jgi:ribonuclease PH
MFARKDLRALKQARPFSVELGLVTTADGSAEVTAGETRVIAAVTGPAQPRFGRHELIDRANLEITVELAAKPLNDTGDATLQKRSCEQYLSDSLQSCIQLYRFPRMLIVFNVTVIRNNGSLLSAALNACVLALLDSGLPMFFVPSAVTICTLLSIQPKSSETTLVLDPSDDEESLCNNTYTFTVAPPAANGLVGSNSCSNLGPNTSDAQMKIIAAKCSGCMHPSELKDAYVLAMEAANAMSVNMRNFMLEKLLPTSSN